MGEDERKPIARYLTRQVFTGLLSGKDLSRAFAAADVFVMPSDSVCLLGGDAF